MAQDKGKNIVTGPPMNPPPRLFPIPFGEFHGCDGDGCASDPDTWPLYDVLRRGVHCRLCCSCILLSHRSLYCCRCFFLVTSPSCPYDAGDTLMAPPAPTVTCQVCREAVAHLPCLCLEPADGVFVCPPCTAAQNGRPFTYAPPCRQPLDVRDARVLFLGGRIALALLQRHATAARATAERLAREAVDARKRAVEAIELANKLGEKEDPSWVVPESPENDLAASEGGGSEAGTNVGEGLLVRINAMPPLGMLTIGTGSSVVATAPAEAQHTPLSPPKTPLFALNENMVYFNGNAAENAEDAAHAGPKRQNAEDAAQTGGPKRQRALNSFNVKEVAMAAAEAARASPPTPQTLQLFPTTKASSSTKMRRSLQLFDDDDEEM